MINQLANPAANALSNPNPVNNLRMPTPGFRSIPRPRPTPVRPTPFMPTYHRGTDFVKQTGPAMLERGEKVIPKEENMDSVKDVLGGHETKKPEKKVKHIVHRRTKNGGHIFEHHFTHPEHHEKEEHAYNSDKDAVAHFMANATDMQPQSAETGAGPEAQGGQEQAQPSPTMPSV